MTTASEKARDVRYGRRAGRWAADGVLNRVQDLHAYKAALMKRGEWPVFEVNEATCRVCWRTTEAHGPAGDMPCWEGLARMAAARRPPDRTELDLEALSRFPNPPSGLTRAAA